MSKNLQQDFIYPGDMSAMVRVMIPNRPLDKLSDFFVCHTDYLYAYRVNKGLLRWNFVNNEIDFLPFPYVMVPEVATDIVDFYPVIYPIFKSPNKVVVVHDPGYITSLKHKDVNCKPLSIFFSTFDFNDKQVYGYFFKVSVSSHDSAWEVSKTIVKPRGMTDEEFFCRFPVYEWQIAKLYDSIALVYGYHFGKILMIAEFQYRYHSNRKHSELVSFEYDPFENIFIDSKKPEFESAFPSWIYDDIGLYRSVRGDILQVGSNRFKLEIPDYLPLKESYSLYIPMLGALARRNAIIVQISSYSCYLLDSAVFFKYLVPLEVLRKYGSKALKYSKLISVVPERLLDLCPDLVEHYYPEIGINTVYQRRDLALDCLFERVGIDGRFRR